jgi:hypothetical protein
MQQLKRVMYKDHPSVVWEKRSLSKELNSAELFDWIKRTVLLLITFGSRRVSVNYFSFNWDLDSIIQTGDPKVKAIVDRLLWSLSFIAFSLSSGIVLLLLMVVL